MKTWLITIPRTQPVKETLIYKVQALSIHEANLIELKNLLPVEVIMGWPYGSEKDIWNCD